jgi:prevent-host-death family protein
MRTVNLAEDIVPIGRFKTHASSLLRRMRAQNRPLVITQSGKPTAVVVTPEEFEALGERAHVIRKIEAGLRSAGREATLSAEEARTRAKAALRGSRAR